MEVVCSESEDEEGSSAPRSSGRGPALGTVGARGAGTLRDVARPPALRVRPSRLLRMPGAAWRLWVRAAACACPGGPRVLRCVWPRETCVCAQDVHVCVGLCTRAGTPTCAESCVRVHRQHRRAVAAGVAERAGWARGAVRVSPGVTARELVLRQEVEAVRGWRPEFSPGTFCAQGPGSPASVSLHSPVPRRSGHRHPHFTAEDTERPKRLVNCAKVHFRWGNRWVRAGCG